MMKKIFLSILIISVSAFSVHASIEGTQCNPIFGCGGSIVDGQDYRCTKINNDPWTWKKFLEPACNSGTRGWTSACGEGSNFRIWECDGSNWIEQSTKPSCEQKCAGYTYRQCSNDPSEGYGSYNGNCYYNIDVFTDTQCSGNTPYCRCWEVDYNCEGVCTSTGCRISTTTTTITTPTCDVGCSSPWNSICGGYGCDESEVKWCRSCYWSDTGYPCTTCGNCVDYSWMCHPDTTTTTTTTSTTTTVRTTTTTSTKKEICNNNRDDDNDGLIDCADPDCAGQRDSLNRICCTRDSHCPPPWSCDHGRLYDGECLAVSFLPPEMPRFCDFAVWNTELANGADPSGACSDGIDEDCDGLTDCADPDCKKYCGINIENTQCNPIFGCGGSIVDGQDYRCTNVNIDGNDQGWTWKKFGNPACNSGTRGWTSACGEGSDYRIWRCDGSDWVEQFSSNCPYTCISALYCYGSNKVAHPEYQCSNSGDACCEFLSNNEICNNDIDDDGDGLVDLDDGDCCNECIASGYEFDTTGGSCIGSKDFGWHGTSVQYCCGDDGNEYHTTRSCLNNEACNTNPSDDSCCSEFGQCVYNYVCFGTLNWHTFGSGNDQRKYCYFGNPNGQWIDCDINQDVCIGQSQTYLGGCFLNWVASGEANVGEYDSIGTLECCGDDSNEYYKCDPSNPSDCACCNSDSDVVRNGECIEDSDIENCLLASQECREECQTFSYLDSGGCYIDPLLSYDECIQGDGSFTCKYQVEYIPSGGYYTRCDFCASGIEVWGCYCWALDYNCGSTLEECEARCSWDGGCVYTTTTTVLPEAPREYIGSSDRNFNRKIKEIIGRVFSLSLYRFIWY